jgi:hypothetical protein
MESKLKVAAALGILEGRYEITDEDWYLAGLVMAKSDETRSAIEVELRDRAERQSVARGKAAGTMKVAADETEHEIKIRQTSQTILHRLESGEWIRGSELRKALRSDHRGYFDDAVAALLVTGSIEKRSTPNGRGEEYRKVG